LKAEGVTGILRVEEVCLQVPWMKKCPGSPIIDVPIVKWRIKNFANKQKET